MASPTMSPSRRRKPLSSRLRSRQAVPDARGFSLAETLVALVIASILFLAALSMLVLDKRVYLKDDAVNETARESRSALERIEREALMAGYLVDVRTIADNGPDGTASTSDDIVGQPKIVHAGPWDLTFNADLDPAIEAVQRGGTGDTLPNGYYPVTFYTGAESIRYTLDSNDDGTVNAADRGDELEESVSQNTGLFLLRRETYGFQGGTNVGEKVPVALVRGPVNYPSGARPQPAFLYWGRFDSDAALDLWGDTGAGGGVAGNGMLEAGEIAALGPVTIEDTNGNGAIDAGEDRNADGVLARRISDLVDQVEVRLTAETTQPDKDLRDTVRSSTTTPFRYRVTTINTIIKPRNMDLAGGACGDDPEHTAGPTLTNACPDALADGKVRMDWTLSGDDGAGETDVEKYIIFRTDANGLFGPTPYDEVLKAVDNWTDDWVEMRTWPPKQYWYRPRAMDCTPRLSVGDPVAGPYPAAVGGMYAPQVEVLDVPGDDGTNLDVVLTASPDDPANTTGYGADVAAYHVYRATSDDYRCVAPVNNDAVAASGAPSYVFRDNGTNSTSALAYGTLYYYWNRTVDDSANLSPYSPRYCGRPYTGPGSPTRRGGKIANYDSNDHPMEVWFEARADNEAAGYDPSLIDYNVYKSSSSRVDITVGYPSTSLVATVRQRGTLVAVGGSGTGRVFRSLDGGATYRQRTDASAPVLQAISFGSLLDGVIVSTTGEVFWSNDGGVGWTAGTSPTTNYLTDVVHVSERIAVAAGNSGTIIRTTDGGATWVDVSSGTVYDLRGLAVRGNTILAAGRGGTVLLSTDQGETFTTLTSPAAIDLASAGITDVAGTVYLLAGTTDGLYWSNDMGGSWTFESISVSGQTINDFACVEGFVCYAISRFDDKVFRGTGPTAWTQEPVSPYRPRDVATLFGALAFVVDDNGDVHRRQVDGTWETTDFSSQPIRGIAARPEIVWQDTTTANAASGTQYFYVVTASYSQGVTALDGESLMLPDRPASDEVPDDGDPQILVDSCQNVEIAITAP